MKTKMIWANLRSSNLEKTIQFYTALGFTPNGNSDEIASFMFGDNGFVINFIVRERFERALNGEAADLTQGNEVMFSLSAATTEEVDHWCEKVKAIGGRVFMEPQGFLEGYTFGFEDVDGHRFNVLWWPGM